MIDFKIILYGEYGVGKTSLTTRLLRRKFDEYSSSTIGASFMTWRPELVRAESKPQGVGFGIWDTAGQERFSSLLPMYLRGSDAVFYCWDYNTPFDESVATKMYQKAMDHSPECHFYLVMTKVDKAHGRIKNWTAETWAEDTGIKGLFYTSAMTGQGVQELFTETAKNLLKSPPPRPPKEPSVQIAAPSRFSKPSCCGS